MDLKPGQKLLMIGDSITDCERVRPVGEGLWGGPGKGYVALVDGLLGSAYPELGIRVVNMGSNGHRVVDLRDRWETDVLALKPDWLSVMIGTNDVWRQFDSPREIETHVPIDVYEQTYSSLLERTRSRLSGLVLMTPFYIDPNRKDPMRAAMDRYGDVVSKLAEKYDAVFVDTQASFDAACRHYYPATLAWDRVHPNHIGHMILARAFVNSIGFQWQGAIDNAGS